MIPIQCPRCGKTGKVPPDRLGGRLACKRCQTIFHMDGGGRIVLGEPGSSNPSKGVRLQPSLSSEEFNLAKTWTNTPKLARFGVPAAFVLMTGWMLFPASSTIDYEDQAEVVARALVSGDRSKVIKMATPASAEAAEKWFDLMSKQLTEVKAHSPQSNTVRASLMSGNPERDASLEMIVVVLSGDVNTSMRFNVVKEGGGWKFDAMTALGEAEKVAAIQVASAKRK